MYRRRVAWGLIMVSPRAPTVRLGGPFAGRAPASLHQPWLPCSHEHLGAEMHVLRIEHPVRDYARWKAAFDGQAGNRMERGVRHHRVLRSVDDQAVVLIDLDFDSSSDAASFLDHLRELWSRVVGTLIDDPRARIVEVVESEEH